MECACSSVIQFAPTRAAPMSIFGNTCVLPPHKKVLVIDLIIVITQIKYSNNTFIFKMCYTQMNSNVGFWLRQLGSKFLVFTRALLFIVYINRILMIEFGLQLLLSLGSIPIIDMNTAEIPSSITARMDFYLSMAPSQVHNAKAFAWFSGVPDSFFNAILHFFYGEDAQKH